MVCPRKAGVVVKGLRVETTVTYRVGEVTGEGRAL